MYALPLLSMQIIYSYWDTVANVDYTYLVISGDNWTGYILGTEQCLSHVSQAMIRLSVLLFSSRCLKIGEMLSVVITLNHK